MRTDHRSGEPHENRHIAVIGSGIAGLSAAWLLSKRWRVTLYEADGRPGGHSNTVEVPSPKGPLAVDTGFIVYNERNYPNLTALFAHLGVATQASMMSFAASLADGALEYSSEGLRGLWGQGSNIVNLRFWRMLGDITRFYYEAPRLLRGTPDEAMTLGDFLAANNYSEAFVEDHLLPMGAAIWSTTAQQMRDYPLVAFVRFFVQHGLLDLANRPKWRTVSGGSREYVKRLLAGIGETRLDSAVAEIRRDEAGVTIIERDGTRQRFTDVVVATHADQALRLLADADPLERELLGAFSYTPNEAVLHTDLALMPRRRQVWSSWNYIGERGATGERPLCVTYWMNQLQRLDTDMPVLVTLNPTRPVAGDKVLGRFAYTHPLFDRRAVAAQQDLWQLQGRRRTFFAGSYFGHGFHEDALQAGLAAAEALGGVERPWRVDGQSDRIAGPRVVEAAE